VAGHVNAKTMQYFMGIWPILMSLGLGGSIIGAFYSVMNFVYGKIRERWMCSVQVSDKDPTFGWVQKYIKDEEMIKEEGWLKVSKKPPDDDQWNHPDRMNKKAKPEV